MMVVIKHLFAIQGLCLGCQSLIYDARFGLRIITRASTPMHDIGIDVQEEETL